MANLRSTLVREFMIGSNGKAIKQAIAGTSIFPDKESTFRAMDMEENDIRLVVVGSEPYTDGSADGLAFSSFRPWGEMHPITEALLCAIRRQLYGYMGEATFKGAFPTGNLLNWQRNGALLLNTILSSVEGRRGAHVNAGWQQLTGRVLRRVMEGSQPKAVLLIGKQAAQLYDDYGLDIGNHQVWRLPHNAESIASDVSTFAEIHRYLHTSYESFPFWKHEHKDYSDCATIDVDRLIKTLQKDIAEAQVPLPGAKDAIAELKQDALRTMAELGMQLRCNMNYIFDFRTKL